MSAIILLISVIFVLFMLSIFTIIGIAIFIFTIEEMVEKERDEY